MNTRLTLSTFNRAIRNGTSNLNEILTEANNTDVSLASAKADFESLLEVANKSYSEISQRLEPYMVLDPLPEGLSEEALDDGVRQISTLNSQIIKQLRSSIINLSPTEATNKTGATVPCSTGVSKSLVSLPRIDCPHFTGLPHDYINFHSRFSSLIHNNQSLSTLQKFQYLISSLSSEPLKVIEHLPLIEDNYDIALTCLRDRYYNPRRTVIHHTEQLLNLPNFDSRSVTSMLEFIDKFNSNFRALNNIEGQDTFQSIFITYLFTKLDNFAKSRFESSYDKPNEFPSVTDVMNLLQTLAIQKENTTLVNSSSKPEVPVRRAQPQRKFSSLVTASSSNTSCALCQSPEHKLYACSQFLSKLPQDRFNSVKQLKLCSNCLGNHNVSKCTSRKLCRSCSKKHHSLLHFIQSSPSSNINSNNSSAVSPIQSSTVPNTSLAVVDTTNCSSNALTLATTAVTTSKSILMATCLVRLQINPDSHIIVRAVLDTASHASIVTERCAQLLQPKRCPSSSVISGVGNTITKSSGLCHLSLATLTGDIITHHHPFLIMNKIAALTPVTNVSTLVHEATAHLTLADPTFHKPSPIDVLLGADITAAVILSAPKSLGQSLPYVINTRFGHVLLGDAPSHIPCMSTCVQALVPQLTDSVSLSSLHHDFHSTSEVLPSLLTTSNHGELMQSLERFWQVEEPPAVKSIIPPEQKYCEELYSSTTSRLPDGRYVVRLPFKQSSMSLGSSYQAALTRLRALERKFNHNPEFRNLYVEFMRDYEAQGHMRAVDSTAETHYFIPHHGIFKTHGDTSKIRVVFDASATSSSGCSLNDLLYSGPKLQAMISDVITLFRKHKYTFTSDVTKMFRQIRIHEADQPYQCILWREAPDRPITIYYLTTVTYGVSSSPYLALRTLTQLATDEGHSFPAAAAVLRDQTFVDDCLFGADTISDALSLRNDIINLLAKGGFTLKKWSSNYTSLIDGIPQEDCEGFPSNSVSSTTRILGLLWDTASDKFSYDISSIKIAAPNSPVTKRTVLSQIAQIYDPVGWVSPIVMRAKCFLQQLWLHPLDWDSPLPNKLAEQWHSIIQSLSGLSAISISRPLSGVNIQYQLHGFSDASKHGYAAVLYLRSCSSNPTVTLIASKTRVAPLKTPTLPRLELMGAHLLANLTQHYHLLFQNHLNLVSVSLWCDSKIVLDWLKIPPIQLKPFVGNRVAQILEWTSPTMWNHVSSEDNPADVASRGTVPSQLVSHSLWWSGPTWLSLSESQWPNTYSSSVVEKCEETKQSSLATCTTVTDMFPHVSSWSMILQIVSRFVEWRYRKSRTISPFLLNEIAFVWICRYIQLQSFRSEIKLLEQNQLLPKQLQRLAPFLDNDGLIRIGGRFPTSSPKSCPVLLPKQHRFVLLLIDYYHLLLCHAGSSLLQAQLSRKVWILSSRQVIRSRVFACVRCYKARPISTPPLMGKLPDPRISPSPAFYHTGMDFAGPFSAKLHHLRKASQVKVYLCIFICFATKAVHLELALDLSTSAFLDVLRRFISRRSAPGHLYSDCGTNFVGGCNQLKKEIKTFLSSSADSVVDFTANQGIQFHFIPPSAPHQGGLWERSVKSAKFHLTRVLGNQVPTVFQLSSLFTRIEGILNSRPLVAMSSDPTSLDVLTPGHFLVGRPLVSPPEPDVQNINDNLLSKYNLVQALSQRFWTRWRSEYLPTLYPRSKWTVPSANLQVGDLVLLEEPNAPPLSWPLGRITETFPGADGVVRKARVRTTSGEYLRPATRLYKLPLSA